MLEWFVTHTPIIFFAQDLWRDEAFSYLISQKPWVEMIVLTARDFSPPLYYIMLKVWIGIFGGSELVMRIPSLLFYWGAVYGCCLILERRCKLSVQLSIIISLFIAMNPLLVYYAAEARGYAMLTFFTVWSFYFFLGKKYRWYVLMTVLGLYTHYFMVFVPLVQMVWLGIIYSSKKACIRWIKVLFIVAIFFLPWVVFMSTVKTLSGEFWIEKPGLIDLTYVPAMIYTGFVHNEWFFKETWYPWFFNIFSVGIAMYGLIIGGIIYARNSVKKYNWDLSVLFILWGLGIPLIVFMLATVKSLYFPRYLILATPGLLLLLGYIVVHLPARVRIVAFLAFFCITGYYLHMEIQYRTKRDIKPVVYKIKPLLEANDRIYTTDMLDFHVLQYYFGEDAVFMYNIPYENIPHYVGKVLMPPEHVTFQLPQYPAKAYVFDGGDGYTVLSQQ